MNPVYQSAFLKALGWSLIDSLWQMGTLWLIYTLLTRNGKKFSSSLRYFLALTALISGSAFFMISLVLNYQNPERGFSIFSNESFLTGFMPLLSTSYLVITTFYIARWIYRYTGNRTLLHSNLEPAGDEASLLVNELKRITSVSRQIKVWCSANIYTPLTTGFLKPVILLPVAAFTQLSSRQIEALIVHEFFHIKRNDYLVHLITSFAEAFLFFNPFAKLLLKNINHERENCCDDEVIRLGYDRWEYAHALYILGKNNQPEFMFALSATGDKKHLLLARVKRLLKAGTTGYSIKKPLTIFFLCLFGAGSMTKTAIKEQQIKPITLAATPVFEVKNTLYVPAPVYEEQPAIIFVKKKIKPLEKLSAPPPPPAPITVTWNIPNEESHAFYVSTNIETINYTMIEAPVSCTQKPADCDPTQPFVPGSTFYFPDHELSITIDGKKTISL